MKKNVGETLKEIRKVKKLTQENLAKKANISRTYLSDIENNRYSPSIPFLKKVSKALSEGITTKYYMLYDDIYTALMEAAGYIEETSPVEKLKKEINITAAALEAHILLLDEANQELQDSEKKSPEEVKKLQEKCLFYYKEVQEHQYDLNALKYELEKLEKQNTLEYNEIEHLIQNNDLINFKGKLLTIEDKKLIIEEINKLFKNIKQ